MLVFCVTACGKHADEYSYDVNIETIYPAQRNDAVEDEEIFFVYPDIEEKTREILSVIIRR